MLALGVATCGNGTPDDEVVRLYTSVTQDTVDAVVAGFAASHPDLTVEVFRAPTGELTARIAAEERAGGLQADVLWLTDPLSIQQYDREGMLRSWQPVEAAAIPEEYRTGSFFGTRVLNLVIVAGMEAAAGVADWNDLTTVSGGVAMPDPAFAGSAFGALAFFVLDAGFGIEFYRALAANEVTEVRSPGDVVTGVAEGLYAAGISLDRTVRGAIADGSPVELVWPVSGAIAIYSPIAVVDATGGDSAETFVTHVLGVEGQTAIAATGWEPARRDVEWSRGGLQVVVDWAAAFDRQEDLLAEYATVFEQ